MTAGQPLDPEAELAQPLLRKINLAVLKGIFVAAADKEREPIAISLVEAPEVELIALRLVVGYEAGRCGEVEQAIVAVHRAIEFADLGVRHLIALGPQLPY